MEIDRPPLGDRTHHIRLVVTGLSGRVPHQSRLAGEHDLALVGAQVVGVALAGVGHVGDLALHQVRWAPHGHLSLALGQCRGHTLGLLLAEAEGVRAGRLDGEMSLSRADVVLVAELLMRIECDGELVAH